MGSPCEGPVGCSGGYSGWVPEEATLVVDARDFVLRLLAVDPEVLERGLLIGTVTYKTNVCQKGSTARMWNGSDRGHTTGADDIVPSSGKLGTRHLD